MAGIFIAEGCIFANAFEFRCPQVELAL